MTLPTGRPEPLQASPSRACVVGWGVVGLIAGFPSWWQVALYSTTSAVTVVMVFAIQHTQHREQLVTQRKLDELVRAQPGADDRLIAAEAATDHELDELIDADVSEVRTIDHSWTATEQRHFVNNLATLKEVGEVGRWFVLVPGQLRRLD